MCTVVRGRGGCCTGGARTPPLRAPSGALGGLGAYPELRRGLTQPAAEGGQRLLEPDERGLGARVVGGLDERERRGSWLEQRRDEVLEMSVDRLEADKRGAEILLHLRGEHAPEAGGSERPSERIGGGLRERFERGCGTG